MSERRDGFDAVLFDIDGTLVDSNYQHVDAWQLAFDEVGIEVEARRIHQAIGMDSDRLLQELIGASAERDGERATEAHARFYGDRRGRLRAFPGARALLDRLTAQETAVVLATSAAPEELEVLLGVLELAEGDILTTDSGDVETAKPHPDLVHVALERAGTDASRAVFVGDTVWDMIAAKRAGVATVAVLTGGIGAAELLAAGADEVVDGVEDLLDREDWPRA